MKEKSYLAFLLLAAVAAMPQQSSTRTRVVMLGTGTPRPFPDRSGPATAIIVDDRVYLVDAGVGVMRRAAAAVEKGIPAVDPVNLNVAFITHLHSDHTIGLPDLIFTGWMMGRHDLNIYGPEGTQEMTKSILQAWRRDIEVRTHGEEARSTLLVQAHDVEPGVIYKDDKVTVKAIPVAHGSWKQAFAYRFDTPDRIIVISGDTSPTEAIVKACSGCDLLIHEVYSPASMVPGMPDWKSYRKKYHTSTSELAAIANQAKPKMLIVYHISGRGVSGRIPDEQILSEIRNSYAGKIAIAKDLDVY